MVAIRVFATAGRFGNFTQAAQALGITQSAVSRHVAALESLAELKLFERRGPHITLTPSGSQFYEAVRDAVFTIELAAQQMVQGQKSRKRVFRKAIVKVLLQPQHQLYRLVRVDRN